MKRNLYTLGCFIFTFILYPGPSLVFAQIGKVGINTNTPQAMLHVKDSSVVFTGTISLPVSPGLPPVSGGGTRMMWYPAKAAFRVGWVSGSHWDRDSIGNYSMAMGRNTKAKGQFSTAFGNETTASASGAIAFGSGSSASGANSTAMGFQTLASAFNSLAMGQETIASGVNSVAMGSGTIASGNYTFAIGVNSNAIGQHSTALSVSTNAVGDRSVAMGSFTSALGYASTSIGQVTQANGYGSLVVGTFNDTIIAAQSASNSITPSTPLFIVGNGNSSLDRSNAMIVRKDGHVGLGTNNPINILDVEGGLAVGSAYSGTNTAPVNGAIIQGNTGIGTPFVVNTLDIEGRMAVGNAYSGTYAAPVNGAIIQGNVGIGTSFVVNKLDVEGGMAVGASYSGSQGAPSQGLIVQGNTGIGTPTPFNRLDVEGGMAVGASYSGGISAPANGMIVQGNVGIGTSSPDRKLHVYTGSSGASANASAIGVFESPSNTYITVLSSSADESGILFSLPEHSAHGGIVYNNPASLEGLQLRTNGNIPRMTITADGNVGIKTQTPSELLHVGTTAGDGIQIGSFEILRDAGATALSLNAHFLPDSDNTYDLGSAGNRWDDVWATNGVIQTSDARDKKDIAELDAGLEAIMKLRPVQYRWKNSPDQNMQLGLLAQEVQHILPEVVRSTNFVSDEDGTISEVNTERLGMNYATLTPVMIKAIQEQQELIIQQQQALDQQALIIQDLLTRLDTFEQALVGQPSSISIED